MTLESKFKVILGNELEKRKVDEDGITYIGAIKIPEGITEEEVKKNVKETVEIIEGVTKIIELTSIAVLMEDGESEVKRFLKEVYSQPTPDEAVEFCVKRMESYGMH